MQPGLLRHLVQAAGDHRVGVAVRASTRTMVVAVVLGVVACAATGCATTRGVARGDERPAELRVVSDPDGATVYVDDAYFGSARVLEVRPRALPLGRHQVTIKAPGYFPHDLDVDLEPGVTTVRIKLRPVVR